ncbi:MAG: nucleoside-diphosphate kinase [bacterium]|nr:nucleoside-diphosphate kinase [bacterium]
MNKNHPKFERTFVILKPDAVQRSLTGEIVRRLERTGLKFVGMKMIVATREQATAHYGKDDAWCEKVGGRIVADIERGDKKAEKKAIEYGREILNGLLDFLTSSPVVIMALEGNEAVGVVKKIVGGTEPLTSDVGTIRGDLTSDSYGTAGIDGRAVRNLVHCSDKIEEAERELAIWFTSNELISYTHIQEKMLYDVNLDGILE